MREWVRRSLAWLWLRPRWDAVAGMPEYAMALTMLLAMVGLFASLYADELKRSTPFTAPWSGTAAWASWHVYALWTGLLVAALMFWRQRVIEAHAQRALHRSATEIERLQEKTRQNLETMPSKQFLEHFRLMYEKAAETALLVLDARKAEAVEVEQAIRNVLTFYARTAESYDGEAGEQGLTYHANVMRFSSIPADEETRNALRERMKFNADRDVSTLRGCLETVVVLSTSTSGEGEPDGALRSLCLPVPIEARRMGLEKPWRVLPGAPKAYCPEGGFHDVCLSVESMLRWCREQTELPPDALREMELHFSAAESAGVQSFLSVRLPTRSESQPSSGVVNLHRQTPGILKNRLEAAAMFVNVSYPFYVLLTRLLDQLDRASRPTPSRRAASRNTSAKRLSAPDDTEKESAGQPPAG